MDTSGGASRSAVKPEHGPTLPDLLRPWWARAGRPARLAAAVAAALALALAAAGLVALRGDEQEFVHRDSPAFNLRYSDGVTRVTPRRGELLRLEQRRDGLFIQSFAVRDLRLPPYRGALSGMLPAYAEAYKAGLARRLRGFTASCNGCSEGKTRINDVPGYAITYRAKLGGRTLYGRDVLLFPDTAGVRDGVVLELLVTPASRVANPGAVGNGGLLKMPLRTFRFGTEA